MVTESTFFSCFTTCCCGKVGNFIALSQVDEAIREDQRGSEWDSGLMGIQRPARTLPIFFPFIVDLGR